MAVNLSFIGGAGWQFLTNDAQPLSGGKLYTYAAGTTTPLTTYTSRTGATPNTNPIILDSAGRTPEQIWSTEGLLYKYVVKDSDDVTIRSWDNIGGSVVASDLAQDLAASSGSSLVGFLQAGTGAVATTVQTKLRESVSVKDFGAVGDGLTDNQSSITAALTYCNSTGAELFFPAGNYNFSTGGFQVNSGVRVYGEGPYSKLTCTASASANSPIFYVTGERIKIDSLRIRYQNFQTGIWSACIYVKNTCYESIFERLLLERGSYGIYCKYNTFNTGDTSINYFYSNSVRDIRISEYSQMAMFISVVNGGNSGNVFCNIYTINYNNDVGGGTKRSASFAMFFEACDDSIGVQLNAEHCNFTGGAFYWGTCRAFTLKSAHVEGATFTNDYGGVFDVSGSRISVEGITFAFNTINVANLFSLFRLNAADVICSNIQERDNTVVSGPNLLVIYAATSTSYAWVNSISTVSLTTPYNGVSQTPNVLQQYNTILYPSLLRSTGPVIALGTGSFGTIDTTYSLNINGGNECAEFRVFGTVVAQLRNFNGVTSGASATAASFIVQKDTSTSRSINAAGTINASGADYAEYEYNNGLVIPKGSIVGFKADGTLTLNFAEAVRFGIKSTDPAYVGGDCWASESVIGSRPEALKDTSSEDERAIYEQQLAEFELRLEAARLAVDRIAYAGKVPVNVLGAIPGGYVIATQAIDGSICGTFVDDLDFDQYKKVVGRVNRILDDGRAEVAVIVH